MATIQRTAQAEEDLIELWELKLAKIWPSLNFAFYSQRAVLIILTKPLM